MSDGAQATTIAVDGATKPAAPRPRDDGARRELDAVKGLLIVLIVVGHTTLITLNWLELYHGLYLFHVFGFLLLPLLSPPKRLSGREVLNRACRYLVPYAACAAALGLLFLVLARRHDPGGWARDFALALPVGSARLLDRATGFQVYWFLPALFTLTLLRDALAAAPRSLFWTALALLVAVHGLVGMAPDAAKELAPMGVLIAAYALPLGLLCRWAWVDTGLAAALSASRFPALSTALAGLLALNVLAWPFLAIYARAARPVNVGYLLLLTYRQPLELVKHDLLAVLPFLAILALAPLLARVPGLAAVGRHSLVVYLAHSVLYQLFLRTAAGPVTRVMRASGAADTERAAEMLAGAVGVVLVVAACVGLGVLLERVPPVRRAVLPRSAGEWPPTAWLLRRRAAGGEGSAAAGPAARA